MSLNRFLFGSSPRKRGPSLRPRSWPWIPAFAQGCPGKSGIAELQLIGGCSLLGFVEVKARRPVDCGEVFSRKQELADEFGKAQGRQAQGIQACDDAQEEIGDQRGDDLQANGIVVVAEKLADTEMLLDPAEQQFDLPAAFVECGDLDR